MVKMVKKRHLKAQKRRPIRLERAESGQKPPNSVIKSVHAIVIEFTLAGGSNCGLNGQKAAPAGKMRRLFASRGGIGSIVARRRHFTAGGSIGCEGAGAGGRESRAARPGSAVRRPRPQDAAAILPPSTEKARDLQDHSSGGPTRRRRHPR